jgi:putative FmdB family regulatory protein
MPTYDYLCKACDHAFELFQQMSAPHETTCPECGAESLKRLVGTGAGILFKGSGFYETDYRSSSYKEAAESDRKAEKSDSSPKEQSGDTKKSSGESKAKDTPAKKSESD